MCISLIISDVEHFSCIYWPFVCLLLINIYSDFLPIFKLNFCIVWALYVFWLFSSFQMGSLKIFFPTLWIISSLCWLFPLLCRRLFNLMWSYFPMFALVAYACGILLKKFLLRLISLKVSTMFYFSSFIVWGLIFKPLICFDLIFV